ncbi:unnamed protein product [Protopolystoma xenopodis]|uniref:Uncharacterized protein n=1 Tax=Protopolystoma xenopodis TaxID=117903 RepID=A0A448WPW3_9PLAT|nr:unnamed protein product [Protopolystoma xenopodis]
MAYSFEADSYCNLYEGSSCGRTSLVSALVGISGGRTHMANGLISAGGGSSIGSEQPENSDSSSLLQHYHQESQSLRPDDIPLRRLVGLYEPRVLTDMSQSVFQKQYSHQQLPLQRQQQQSTSSRPTTSFQPSDQLVSSGQSTSWQHHLQQQRLEMADFLIASATGGQLRSTLTRSYQTPPLPP